MREPRVRIVTDREGYPPHQPVVLVDGEPLRAVTRIEFAPYSHAQGGPMLVTLTLLGVDVALDLEAAPEHLVRVVGPPGGLSADEWRQVADGIVTEGLRDKARRVAGG